MASNNHVHMVHARDIDYWMRLASTLKRLREVVGDFLKSDDTTAENEIFKTTVRLSRRMDWYCNQQVPEGGYSVSNEDKEEMIRKALGSVFPCIKASKISTKDCNECEVAIACHSSRGSAINHPTEKRKKVIEEIRSGIEAERKNYSEKRPAENAISFGEFHKTQEELNKHFDEIANLL
jgi:hypothetical protein